MIPRLPRGQTPLTPEQDALVRQRAVAGVARINVAEEMGLPISRIRRPYEEARAAKLAEDEARLAEMNRGKGRRDALPPFDPVMRAIYREAGFPAV